MKARPILFSGPMVRALLDGRKTQTRRVIKPQPETRYDSDGEFGQITGWLRADRFEYADGSPGCVWRSLDSLPCPYGGIGDVLWVRETAEADHETSDAVTLSKYAADGSPVLYPGPDEDEYGEPSYGGSIAHWWYSKNACPSIHMPRWASRLTLELTGVRVERLKDISRADAAAEGVCFDLDKPLPDWCQRHRWPEENYRALWESLNGPGSWHANPYVWVLTFKVHRCNVDQLIAARAA